MTSIVSTMTGTLRSQLDTFFATVSQVGGLGDIVKDQYARLATAMDASSVLPITAQATTGFTQEVRDVSNQVVGYVVVTGSGFSATGEPLTQASVISQIRMENAAHQTLLQLDGAFGETGIQLDNLQIGSLDIGAQIKLTANDLGATINNGSVTLTGNATALEFAVKEGDSVVKVAVGGDLKLTGDFVVDNLSGQQTLGNVMPGLDAASSIESLSIQRINYQPGTTTVASTDNLLNITGLALSPADMKAISAASEERWNWVDPMYGHEDQGGWVKTFDGTGAPLGYMNQFSAQTPVLAQLADGSVVVGQIFSVLSSTTGGTTPSSGAESYVLKVAKYTREGMLDTSFSADGYVDVPLEKGMMDIIKLETGVNRNTGDVFVSVVKPALSPTEPATISTLRVDGFTGAISSLAQSAVPPDVMMSSATGVTMRVKELGDGSVVRYVLADSTTAGAAGKVLSLQHQTASGQVDTGFGVSGTLTYTLANGSSANGGASTSTYWGADTSVNLVETSDGLLAFFATGPMSGSAAYQLVKFGQDGVLDASFGSQGVVYNPAPSMLQVSGFTARVLSDGDILVVASCRNTVENGQYEIAAPSVTLVRYNANGEIDTSYGDEGYLTVTFASSMMPSMYAPVFSFDAEGNLTVACLGTEESAANAMMSNVLNIVRFHPDGTLDTGFGSDGILVSNPLPIDQYSPSNAYQGLGLVSAMADGSVMVVGNSMYGSSTLLHVAGNGVVEQSWLPYGYTTRLVVDQIDGGFYQANSYYQSQTGMLDANATWVTQLLHLTPPVDPETVLAETLFAGNDTLDMSGVTVTDVGVLELKGYAGDDVLKGSAGSDILIGGSGSDTLVGLDGNDTYVFVEGEVGNDVINDAGEGATAPNNSSSDVLEIHTVGASVRSEILHQDNDLVLRSFNSLTQQVISQLTIKNQTAVVDDQVVNGAGAVEIVRRFNPDGSLDSELRLAAGSQGTDADDLVVGTVGADTLHGGLGSNTLLGGAGDDALYADGGTGYLDGGTGSDTLYVGTGDFVDADGAEGMDTAVLEGQQAEWTFVSPSGASSKVEAARFVAGVKIQSVGLYDVENVQFGSVGSPVELASLVVSGGTGGSGGGTGTGGGTGNHAPVWGTLTQDITKLPVVDGHSYGNQLRVPTIATDADVNDTINYVVRLGQMVGGVFSPITMDMQPSASQRYEYPTNGGNPIPQNELSLYVQSLPDNLAGKTVVARIYANNAGYGEAVGNYIDYQFNVKELTTSITQNALYIKLTELPNGAQLASTGGITAIFTPKYVGGETRNVTIDRSRIELLEGGVLKIQTYDPNGGANSIYPMEGTLSVQVPAGLITAGSESSPALDFTWRVAMGGGAGGSTGGGYTLIDPNAPNSEPVWGDFTQDSAPEISGVSYTQITINDIATDADGDYVNYTVKLGRMVDGAFELIDSETANSNMAYAYPKWEGGGSPTSISLGINQLPADLAGQNLVARIYANNAGWGEAVGNYIDYNFTVKSLDTSITYDALYIKLPQGYSTAQLGDSGFVTLQFNATDDVSYGEASKTIEVSTSRLTLIGDVLKITLQDYSDWSGRSNLYLQRSGELSVKIGEGVLVSGEEDLSSLEFEWGLNQANNTWQLASLGEVEGTDGDDNWTGTEASERYNGGLGNDVLSAGAGNDTVDGGAGNDRIDGGEGDDRLTGGAGDDVLDGGAGKDTARYSARADRFIVSREVDEQQREYIRVEHSQDGSVDKLYNIENLSFDDGDKKLSTRFTPATDFWGRNQVDGSDIDDLIDTSALVSPGANDRDRVDAGAGNDHVNAGAGDDEIIGGAGNDILDGGVGSDTAIYAGRSSRYTITKEKDGEGRSVTIVTDTEGLEGTDRLYGIEAIRFEGDGVNRQLSAQFNAGQGEGSWVQNNIHGTDLDDEIDANALAVENGTPVRRDWIDAGAGNDIIRAGQGGDTITGGAGNDLIDGGDDTTAARLSTNGQVDTWNIQNRANYSGPAKRYEITQKTDDALGTKTGVANAVYVEVKDLRSGSPDGTDILLNIDVLQFNDKEVRLTPSYWLNAEYEWNSQSQQSTIKKVTGVNAEGTDFAETLGVDEANVGTVPNGQYNFSGSDRIVGGAGNDIIYGGAGADTLVGGKGNDQLFGGSGKADSDTSWQPNGAYGADVAEYSGNADRYKITLNPNGTVTVQDTKGDKGDGTDTLTGIEVLRFADGEKNLTVIQDKQFEWGNVNGQWQQTTTLQQINWRGSDFADTINSEANGDTRDYVTAGAGNDTIRTGAGADWIDAGEGDDFIDAGANGSGTDPWSRDDVVRYEAAAKRFTISMSEDATTHERTFTVTDKLSAEFGGFGVDTLKNVERIEFSEGGSVDLQVRFDTWVGSTQNNINGTQFKDVIDAETLGTENNSQATSDNINVGAGDDVVYAGAGGDRITDGAGNDFYDGGADGNNPNDSWGNQDRVSFNGAQKRFNVDVLDYSVLDASIKALITAKYSGENVPANVVRVTDKLPDASGGLGTNYVINVEQLEFQDGQVSLGVSASQWRPYSSTWGTGYDTWVGSNYYTGGILNDTIDARVNDAVGTNAEYNIQTGQWSNSNGVFSNRDYVDGGAGNDIIYTGAGGDEIRGGKGDDYIDAGANGNSGNTWDDLDRVVFAHSINRYDITFFRAVEAGTGAYNEKGVAISGGSFAKSAYYVPDGLMVVADRYSAAMGGEGRDVLVGVEQLSFSDAWETLAVQYSDYDNTYQNWNGSAYVQTQVSNRSAWGTRFGDKIEGGLNAINNLNGNGGDDLIIGGNLRDELTGGGGDDIIDGGANPAIDPTRPWDTWSTYDVARFDANKSEFSITRAVDDAQGTKTGHANQVYYTVEHLIPSKLGGLGKDIVFNVERLQFADGDVQLEVKIDKQQQWNGTAHVDVVSYQGTQFADTMTGTSGNDNFMGNEGDDTIYAGAGDDHIGGGAGNDTIYGQDGDDTIVNLNKGNDVVDGGAGSDSVIYEDTLARFTVELVREGQTVATFTKAGGFSGGASFTAATDSIRVTDHLSSAHGGEGVDQLSNVEKIKFNDGEIDLTTGQFVANQGEGFIADTTLTVNAGSGQNGGTAPTVTAFPTLAVTAVVKASDNTDHNIANASHDPIITVQGKDFWAFKSLDSGTGTVTLPQGVSIAGFDGTDIKFEFGDLELSGLDVAAGLSTETWTNADDTPAYFRLYGNGTLIATGTEVKVEAMTDTNPASQNYTKATGKVTVTLVATDADPGFVSKMEEALGSSTITLNLDSFAPEAPPNYNPARSTTNTWNFGVAGAVDSTGADLLPVWSQWHMSAAPVFEAATTVAVDLPVSATDPESQSVTYRGEVGHFVDGVFSVVGGPEQLTLTQAGGKLTGSFTAPAAANDLVLRVYAYDDASLQHGSHIDVPFVTVAANATEVAGRVVLGTDYADTLNGTAGVDRLEGGAGDDTLMGSAGNDILIGGTDGVSTGTNIWGGGDTVSYLGAPSERFDIVRNANGTVTIIDIASVANPVFLDNGHLNPTCYDAPETDILKDVGYGMDTLVGVERVRFSDIQLDLTPQDWSYTYRSTYWNGNTSYEYDVTRHNITGTYADDILVGSSFGDQFDGRGGNDIIDGGVETVTHGNAWEIQDVVRYTGARERYEIKGVLVDIAGTGAEKTYTVVSAAQANGDEVFGIQIKDVLPDSAGGTGTDLLVNVERVEFAYSGSGDNSISIKPELNYYDDWSVTVAEGQARPKSLNARGTVFDDVISGTAYGDWISGGDGNDTLIGGAGGDELEGGKGDDIIIGGANGAADQWGNARTDTARFNASFERFEVSTVAYDVDGDGTVEAGETALQVKDILPSNDSNSLGTDLLIGVENLAFNDRWLSVQVNRWQWTDWQGKTNANAEGTVFSDVIEGDRNTDGTVVSVASRDTIRGNAGNDVLKGGGNGDTLIGGEGHDVLDGGANGISGDAWQDQDTAQFSGDSGRYTVSAITISGTTIKANGQDIATFDSSAKTLTVTATGLAEGVETVLSRAVANLDLTQATYSSGYLVVDSLSSDLGGDGADLVFNTEVLHFANGPMEFDIRANANDWDNDGKLDGVWVTGTANGDAVTITKLAEMTGKSEEALQSTQISAELREGNDVYIGGSGGDWVRPGAGNDYIDGGANTSKNAWGGDMLDEVRFDAKSTRYDIFDIGLTKIGENWTLTSSGLALNSVLVSSLSAGNTLTAVQNLITHAGLNTSISAWMVADKLPAEFEGTGVDVLLNVEAISFTDKWMPLEMQINYWREWAVDSNGNWTMGTKIVGAGVQGTTGNDTIGANATYDFSGNDVIEGNEGDDFINAGAGGDWIRGGAGDDIINGGDDGVADPVTGYKQTDTVSYNGNYDRYVITTESDESGNWIIVADTDTENGSGVDRLVNVESLSFNDRWIRLGVETYTWMDGKGNVSGVNVNGSMLDDIIDVSGADYQYKGKQHWIQGNEGDDILVGGAGPETFVGGIGNDQIVGGENGMDAWGNPGFDTVQYDGMSSRYTIDIISVGASNAVSVGSTTYNLNDQTYVINGVTYSLTVSNGIVSAVLADGVASNDTKIVRVTDSFSAEDGGNGIDLMVGIENISFWDRWITLEAAKTFVDLDGDGKADSSTLVGTDSADTLTGTELNDEIKGGAGNDTLDGGVGGDILIGGAGDDTLIGGDNGTDAKGRMLIDIARYDGNRADYTVTQNENGSYTVMSTADGTDTLTGIEGIQFADAFVSLQISTESKDFDSDGEVDLTIVRGTDFGDILNYASATGAYQIEGAGGDDTITGGSGDDTLEGNGGSDKLYGGEGTDRARFSGNKSGYTISEELTDDASGTVTGVADAKYYTVTKGSEVDTLVGIEELVFADKLVKLGALAAQVTTKDVDTDGDKKADTRFVTGTDEADTIIGQSNMINVIEAGAGDDTVTGGARGDVFKLGAGNDTVDGGANQGLSAGGSAAVDAVVYEGNQAGYTVKTVQRSVFEFAGKVEAGDVFTVTVGGTAYSYTALTGNTLTNVAAALKTTVEAGVSGVTLSYGEIDQKGTPETTDDSITITLRAENKYLGVEADVTNGTHAVSGSYSVSGANQSGSTLALSSAAGITAGMFVSYQVSTTSTGSNGQQTSTTTTYGPYEVTAVSGNSLTLSESLGASPANSASLIVTETNADTSGSATESSYERWVEVSKSGETDTLKNIEQLLFSDSVVDLNPSYLDKVVWDNTLGLTTKTAITGTALADLLQSTTGTELFRGGAGADHFIVGDSSGNDTVLDFAAGSGGDVVTLYLGANDTDGINGTGVDTVTELMAKATDEGGSTRIDLGAGNSLLLVDVDVSTLVAANFEVVTTYFTA